MLSLPDRFIGENMPAKAHASITLYGDANPTFWPEYFGIEPDSLVVKGALFRTPSGRMSRSPGRVGVSGCRSETAAKSDTLDPHIRYLTPLLGMPRLDLPELLTKHQTCMRVFCCWYSDDHEVPVIDGRLQMIVENSGGTIEIDQYPKPDVEEEPDESDRTT